MAQNLLQIRPLTFVTGKGGVGKSTIAAALAYGLSTQGKKVLLVEFGDKSFFEKFFQSKRVQFEPIEVAQGFHVALWDYISCLREYVGFYIKTDAIFDLFFSNQVVQKFIQAAPSLKELALLGKATSGPRKIGPPLGYDFIIVDSYSTGHHRALLKAPFGMSEVIQRGPMGVQSRSMIEVLQNSEYTQHFIVVKPEELPVVEGLELQKNLEKDFKVKSHIVCNQTLDIQNIDSPKTDLDFYVQSEYESQEKYLKLLKPAHFMNVQYHYHKKNRLEFLKHVYSDLMKGDL